MFITPLMDRAVSATTEPQESWTEFLILIAWSFAPFIIGAIILICVCLGISEAFLQIVERRERKREKSRHEEHATHPSGVVY